jgi:hypothetical protein
MQDIEYPSSSNDYEQGLNLLGGTSSAANSVACLEWVWWIMDQMCEYWPV